MANVVAIIPAYNEEKALADVIGKTLEHVDEVIVVDDGSIDETPQFINILKGDMHLIGNRPYLPREIEDMGLYYKGKR